MMTRSSNKNKNNLAVLSAGRQCLLFNEFENEFWLRKLKWCANLSCSYCKKKFEFGHFTGMLVINETLCASSLSFINYRSKFLIRDYQIMFSFIPKFSLIIVLSFQFVCEILHEPN